MFKRLIRDVAWKVLGTPRIAGSAQSAIDTIAPRREIIDLAVTLTNHNTRMERESEEIGSAGTLLGDYLEFGVFQGETFCHAFRRAHAVMPWMRFWAFDSFEGLPEPQGVDEGGEFWGGQFACDRATFVNNLSIAGVDMSRVEIIEGWFHDSLRPELKQDRGLNVASIVYVDADLYESTVPVLNFLTDIITNGSIVMFDDWFCFKGDANRGVQRAFREWLASHPSIMAREWHLFGAYGKAFILNRR